METIYLDHNATTPVDERVVEAMLPYFTRSFANPSSGYAIAAEARRAAEEARQAVALGLGATPDSIIFTSGGTESNNVALKGVVLANMERGRHVVTTAVEHHAVLHTCEYLRDRLGCDLTIVGSDPDGRVDPVDVGRAIRDDTLLVSVMLANNETGVLEPVSEIARLCRERGVLCHTDAVQAVGKVRVDVEELGVDFLSLSAHKLYGPKGVGALYARSGVRFDPLCHGGAHERGRRAGTENVPGIVGLARALRIAIDGIPSESDRLAALTRRLEDGIASRIPDVTIHSHKAPRIPGTTNVAFHFVEGESIVLALDMEGVAVSTGSACTTDTAEPSHVLAAMDVPPNTAQGSVRFGLGRHTTEEEIDRVLELLPGIVDRLRRMSPLYRKASGAHES
ncbi:MAG: aminotransferase class V-fold PLP-dependent enzyme [Candidatus Eisenbacteria bacterium]|nr:aminotransferase class V-fold PLP-dependent enzyme [Candidatus Eisenbacteria bacterium]